MAKWRQRLICVHDAKTGKPISVNLEHARFDFYAKPVIVKIRGERYELKETAKAIMGFIKEA